MPGPKAKAKAKAKGQVQKKPVMVVTSKRYLKEFDRQQKAELKAADLRMKEDICVPIHCKGADSLTLEMSKNDFHVMMTVDKRLCMFNNGMKCGLTNLDGYISWEGLSINYYIYIYIYIYICMYTNTFANTVRALFTNNFANTSKPNKMARGNFSTVPTIQI